MNRKLHELFWSPPSEGPPLRVSLLRHPSADRRKWDLAELPAMRKILTQVEPERIVRELCEVFEEEKEALLERGYKGVARCVLMEMLCRYGGMKQREIGELMGID